MSSTLAVTVEKLWYMDKGFYSVMSGSKPEKDLGAYDHCLKASDGNT